MRLKDLEKIAEGFWSTVWDVTKPAFRAANKAGGKVVGTLAKDVAKKPGETALKAGAAALALPWALDQTGYKTYRQRLADPYQYRSPHSFGHSELHSAIFSPIEKHGESCMPKVKRFKDLEKCANFFDTAAKFGKGMLGYGEPYFLPRIIAGTAIGGAGASLLAPTTTTLAEKLKRGAFPVEDRINMEDEMAKAQTKVLSTYMAERSLRELQQRTRSERDLPVIESVYAGLRKTDPNIMEAYKNPRTRGVMDQTINTVFSFAPDAAKNERVLQSLLTEAISSPEGGLSFHTIKALADTQKSVTNQSLAT